VQKMDPLGKLQVAIKNNVDVHYFSCMIPYHVLFGEDGNLGEISGACLGFPMRSLLTMVCSSPHIEKSDYLSLWKDLGDSSESILPIQ
jgi:hypothetical protein